MILFAQWKASPDRQPSTELLFAESIGVTEQTLNNWKKEDIFKDYLEELVDEVIKEPYLTIIKNLAERAKNGDKAAKIYLDHINKVENRKKGIIGEGSIQVIIHGED